MAYLLFKTFALFYLRRVLESGSQKCQYYLSPWNLPICTIRDSAELEGPPRQLRCRYYDSSSEQKDSLQILVANGPAHLHIFLRRSETCLAE